MLAESLYSKPIICQSCESAEELDIEKQNLLLDLMDIIYVRIFVLGHNLFLEGNIFLELRSGKTVSFFADKYSASALSHQIVTILYTIL